MRVNLLFYYHSKSIDAEISSDLSPICKTHYVQIRLPHFNQKQKKPLIIHSTVNNTLPHNTIKIPAALFGLNKRSPTIDSCDLEPLSDGSTVPTLDTVTISLNPLLYDRLINLPTDQEKLSFLSLKYGIKNNQTVLSPKLLLSKKWAEVVDCSPHPYGVINFRNTKILFVRYTNENLQLDDDVPLDLEDLSIGSQKFKIMCLTNPIPNCLTTPAVGKSDDETLFVFANYKVLLKLNISSGSNVQLHVGSNSIRAKLFLLLEPNNFNSFSIYVHPRIKSLFYENEEVAINKYTIHSIIPTAMSVSLARVGSWHQSQKAFQNVILHRLKSFFVNKNRIVKKGDLIPITFDSSLSHLYNESVDEFDDDNISNNDQLVWFSVESITESDHEDDDNEQEIEQSIPNVESMTKYYEFVIDPVKTKLITSNIVLERSQSIINIDYLKYFNLDIPFQFDPHIFPYANKVLDIIKSTLECKNKNISIETSILLHSTTNSVGKTTLIEFIAKHLGMHLLELDCLSLTATQGSVESTSKIIGYIKAKLENVLPYTQQSIIYISHIDTLFPEIDPNQDPMNAKVTRKLELELFNIIKKFLNNFNDVIFMASANDIDCLPNAIRTFFNFEVCVPVPNEVQRRSMFEWYLSQDVLNRESSDQDNLMNFKACDIISSNALAIQSAGLTPIDIKSIVQTAKFEVASKTHESTNEYLITSQELDIAVSKARDEFSVSIGAPKIPNVTWNDIGGVDQVKNEIMDTIDMPLKHPELFSSGMKKRSGLLFYGPPGTGKTLMAKAIATNFSLNFFSVKGPELLNMYIGESEANVRRVFQRAREAKPCVIFFDEIDSVAPKRGNQGDSGGVMDRIVSQLLAELDGMSSGSDDGSSGEGIFVIGATNRPDLLDEALLRPGRFDKLLYLGIPDTDPKQLNILKALTRKFHLDKNVDLRKIAELCPYNYTGADFYALCSDAMLNAMTRIASQVDDKLDTYNISRVNDKFEPVSLNYWFDQVANKDDIRVTVQMEDFIKSQDELEASVSQEELQHYLKIRQNFES